jgi:hypothetical protein
LGEEDSNPRKQVQSLSSYHWTIPQTLTSPSTISKSLVGVKGKKARFAIDCTGFDPLFLGFRAYELPATGSGYRLFAKGMTDKTQHIPVGLFLIEWRPINLCCAIKFLTNLPSIR